MKKQILCLIGGKLQGVEAAYLAKEAGYFVWLIDKRQKPLCRFLADNFMCFDITQDPKRLEKISESVDYILPVNENKQAIETLEKLVHEGNLKAPVLFDFNAYAISSDKGRSKCFFKKNGILTPKDKPNNPPYFIKPREGSGSEGAHVVCNQVDVFEYRENEYIIEEYIEGPVVSLEVIGNGKTYRVYKETRIHIDEVYDCCRVTPLPENKEYRMITEKLAKQLNLNGIMDIEAIEGNDGLKVMEIDARFPSQTPICIYMSTGINLIEELIKTKSSEFDTEHFKNISESEWPKFGVLEHFIKMENKLFPIGERAISTGENLHLFYKSSNGKAQIYECTGKNGVRAYTFIYAAENEPDAKKMQKKLKNIVMRSSAENE